MNDYLTFQIARDRHNELIQQAQENRQFDRRMRNGTRQVVQSLLSMLPTSRIQIGWLGGIVERVGFGVANFGARLKNPEPN